MRQLPWAPISWAPTIALSWLWGLGFFFSFQVILVYGLLGFLAFAIPNACGLLAFGWILGDPKRDPTAIFQRIQARYAGLFLASQVAAVAITLFASVQYLFIPLFGAESIVLIVAFALLAVAAGHAATIRGLKVLHAVYLPVGLLAATAVLVGLLRTQPHHRLALAALDSRFYGLVLPSLVGFTLGPWTDVQHWQRVIAIRNSAVSVRAAYGWGAGLFLAFLVLNASIAAAAGPIMSMTSFDGLKDFEVSVAAAVAHTHLGALEAAIVIWIGIAIASTLDSFYCATSWLLKATASKSNSPLLAFLSVDVITSPTWFLLTAILIACLAVVTHVSMLYLLIPFANLLAGHAACLLCEVINGKRNYDGTLCTMIGLAAFLTFAMGYIGDIPGFMVASPLIGLIGASSAVKACFWTPASSTATRATPVDVVAAAPVRTPAPRETIQDYGFDGQWFVLSIVPTYDDTTSIGKVYFTSYFRWVGKARELFFNTCMPDFDLSKTDFYVLTKSFTHEFCQEIHEFQPISVRVKIDHYNRKFVTIVHEFHSRTEGLIGRGEQSLMFVDKTHYKPLDIPAIIMKRFLPYYTPNAAKAPTVVFGRGGARVGSPETTSA